MVHFKHDVTQHQRLAAKQQSTDIASGVQENSSLQEIVVSATCKRIMECSGVRNTDIRIGMCVRYRVLHDALHAVHVQQARYCAHVQQERYNV
jgi:hypothetical protein